MAKVMWFRRKEVYSVEESETLEHLKAWREAAGDPDYLDESLLAWCRQRRAPLGEPFCDVHRDTLLPGYAARAKLITEAAVDHRN